MKNIIAALLALAIVGCSTAPTTPIIREQTIGTVQIAYGDDGNWVKITSSGVAPVHNQTPHATSEATKVAVMHAKQGIAEFMNNDFRSEKTTDVKSQSKVHAGADDEVSDNDMTTLTTVVEHMRDNSSAILRGLQVTNQAITKDFVRVEVSATRQSIAASTSLRDIMGRNNQ